MVMKRQLQGRLSPAQLKLVELMASAVPPSNRPKYHAIVNDRLCRRTLWAEPIGDPEVVEAIQIATLFTARSAA